MLAIFAWPMAVALIASAILWYRAEFPERPADRPLDELDFEDFELSGYDPAPGLEFAVAE